ncbi:MAG: hypothetical protein KatS3mg102_2138 [Planctomycetota bacterium]|nr:MAG: hypothetical protein KatS3mg102_2138 [Planctomycetota bacterium]
MTELFYLRVESAGVAMRAGLDDAPLAWDLSGEGLYLPRPINQWLRSGTNALTVLVSAPTDPELAAVGARLRAEVFLHDSASPTPRPARVLARFRWPQEGLAESYPYAARIAFELPQAPPVRLWAEAEPIAALGPQDRGAILEQTRALASAIAERRYEQAWRLVAYRYEEEARASGLELARLREQVLQQYAMIAEQPGCRLLALPEEDLELELVAGRRLVLVSRRRHPEAIAFEDALGAWRIGVYFARLGGHWVIAR